MEETRTYLLKLYDDDLASFTLVRDASGAVRCASAECDESKRGLLPFRVTGDAASFERWIESRTLSKNRTFASRIVRQYGIRFDDAMQMLDACNGLSLNDAYWVVPDGTKATFAETNLYENPFDELVATAAFSGVIDTSRVPEGLSGELTTSGQFPKAWRVVDGERYLYKAGAPNSNGLEPHAEYYAAQLAEALGFSHASYDLARWHGELCSASPLFTSRDTGFATFSSMFGTAPIFDNNLSLFIRDIDAGLTASDLDRSAAWYKSPSNVLLDYQAKRVMTDDLRDRLATLRGFEFAPHSDFPLDERYTELLNGYIRLRLEALLGLS